MIRKHRIPASWRHLVPAAFVLATVLLPLISVKLWAAMMAVYFLAILAASIQSAARYGWSLLPALPIVFFAYHFSYGAGFLLGLMSSTPTQVFTRVTR